MQVTVTEQAARPRHFTFNIKAAAGMSDYTVQVLHSLNFGGSACSDLSELR